MANGQWPMALVVLVVFVVVVVVVFTAIKKVSQSSWLYSNRRTKVLKMLASPPAVCDDLRQRSLPPGGVGIQNNRCSRRKEIIIPLFAFDMAAGEGKSSAFGGHKGETRTVPLGEAAEGGKLTGPQRL